MGLPFTANQFYGVFGAYNTAMWPIQVILLALALLAIIFVAFPRRWSGVVISAILAFYWLWLGIAYHLVFFTAINPLAYGFAVLSILGALEFFWHGVVRRRLEYCMAFDARTYIGFILLIFALAVYPTWSVVAGHGYPRMPTFGLPCPTTIYTIGMLALLVRPYPRGVWIVPVLWTFIGTQAAFMLGVRQDLGLLVAGLAGIVLLINNKYTDSGTGKRTANPKGDGG